MSATPTAPGSAATGEAANATGAARRRIVLRAVALIAIVVVVFVVILPQIVDYQAVGAALASLTGQQLAVLIGATAVAYAANAAPARVLVPGLSWRRAIGADLAGRAVVSTIPGPTDLATKFVLYRQWSIPAETATAGIVFAGFFEQLSALVLPLIATVALIATGHTTRPMVIWLTAIGVAILIAATLLIGGIVRSESLARKLGDWLARLAGRLWGIVHRTPPSGIAAKVMDVRDRSKETLSAHGVVGFGAAVLSKLAWFLVLEVSLWAVGITPDILPPSVVLTTMAAVMLIAFIPITPGGVGVSEVAYIGLLTSVAGESLTGPITAAVLIFRVAQWLVPIPLGWILLVIMRGSAWRLGLDGADPTSPASG